MITLRKIPLWVKVSYDVLPEQRLPGVHDEKGEAASVAYEPGPDNGNGNGNGHEPPGPPDYTSHGGTYDPHDNYPM